jgi:alcohol dehydrogenase/L-iditol 2-dehydrogenase
MRAALLVEPQRIVVDDVPEPLVGPDDVRIAVSGVGLCGSDASVFSGKWATPASPWIMGHEAFGTITEVGELVPAEREGQTVVIEPNVACSTCGQCRRGMTSACENRLSVGMNRPGALAEQLVVPAEYAWPASGLDPATLVCVEPLTVALAALRCHARPLPEAALVVGAGAQGLLMSLALIERGLQVHIRDVNEDRLRFAGKLGLLIEPPTREFELVIDTVGSPAAHAATLENAARGASIIVLGLDDRPLGLSARTLVRNQLELRGSLTYDHPADFQETIAMVGSGRIAPNRIVANEFALEDVQRAFEEAPFAPGKTWVRVS